VLNAFGLLDSAENALILGVLIWAIFKGRWRRLRSPEATWLVVTVRLRNNYGPGRWRKLKGVATVKLESGSVRLAEVHWYEAHGIGKRNMKIKRLLD